jgi:hypothetical protein
MPKITAGGGATNVRAELDPAVPTSAPASGVDDGPTVELTRDEHPHAPAKRPGEHTAFFVGEQGAEREPERVEHEAGSEDHPEAPDGEQRNAEASGDAEDSAAPRPAKRGGRRSS